jgi:hypothetical protein
MAERNFTPTDLVSLPRLSAREVFALARALLAVVLRTAGLPGGIREAAADLEAASRAPTVRLEPAVTGDVVQAAQARRSAALAAASAAAPIEPPPPSAADDKPAAPPRAPDVPRVPPPVDEPKGSGVLGWLVLLALVAGLLVWLLG